MAYIGAHIDSNVKYMTESARIILEGGGNIVQLFVDPLRVSGKKSGEYKEFTDFIRSNKMKFIIHASYVINLSRDTEEHSPSIQLFIAEIVAAYELGAEAIVVHMGKRLDLEKDEALNNMYIGLMYVHEQTKSYPLKILLETSTGQGSEICYKIEEFAYFFKKLSRNKNKAVAERFAVCVDTCHIFAAGYDLRTKAAVYMYIEAFEELIGLRYINLIHLNDSKKELGSNVDRHENIGKGAIGSDGLIEIAKYFVKLKVPIILETPGHEILKDLGLLLKST